MVFTLSSLETIQQVAREVLSYCKGHTIFAFYGEMGVGKTTFIKAICKELGVIDFTNSPSFSIVNEYEIVEGNTVYHFDFYRINSPEEALDMGYEEYVYSGNICLMEWPEKIAALLPPDCVKVQLTENPDGAREIEVCDGCRSM